MKISTTEYASACDFGYDEKTCCKSCLRNTIWKDIALHPYNPGMSKDITFNLTFSGPDCTEITGKYHLFQVFETISLAINGLTLCHIAL